MQSGRRLFVDDYAQIFINRASVTITPRLEVGENVKIGRYASIGCSHSIILEDFVRLAPHVHITDRNHSYDNIEMPITLQPIVFAPVHIKAHTWLGYGSQIMPGVTIGRHCVIAAGSIVTKDIPDYCVAAGVPAKVIKRYNHDTQKWESVRKGVTMHEFQVPENIVPNYNKDLQDKLGGGNSL
jgi:acetyltransferase-like isoleucine patch superfamily enzyme